MIDYKTALSNMFGFVVKQPIHKSLRQMRFIAIIVIGVSIDILYRLVSILESTSALSPVQTVGVVGTLAAAVLGAIWKGISNLSEGHKADDE